MRQEKQLKSKSKSKVVVSLLPLFATLPYDWEFMYDNVTDNTY